MNEPNPKGSQGRRQTMKKQTKQVEDHLDRLQSLTAAKKKRIQELEYKNTEFQNAYIELVSRTAAVCHDLLLTRQRGDVWGTAFAFLVNYSLAHLGLARQCADRKTFDAMLVNLTRMSDAMAKSFPDRKLVIDPWRRAVKTFGEITPPTYDSKPHPHVDSLSPIVLTLRDTGPSLTEFREFYASSESGLHIIRPA